MNYLRENRGFCDVCGASVEDAVTERGSIFCARCGIELADFSKTVLMYRREYWLKNEKLPNI